ncbi:hypothetical protein FA045_11915 [Pedobacter cryotolerans]|uniref:Peptidyl-prolyl cis-trans isomerase n=2 Tax=Pedobacter cryotolerans TaxID=2571270 RepID=A0A4U1C1R5_9SPHI|nr:hypothetical protein FA045_11915 [Pedobacter cryotolerans]
MQMLKKYTLYCLALLSIVILFSACEKEYESIESIDDAKIQAYIKQNNLTMTKDPTGFYYQILEPGTGDVILNKDSIFFNLNVQSLTGTTYFATAKYIPEATYLGYVSPASYRLALNGIKRGGKVRVILPSYLAYGKNGSGPIPSNEVISTTITVLSEGIQSEVDDKIIREFIADKGITNAVKTTSGVYYQVLTAGTGNTVDLASTITAKYTGRFVNGNIFDGSGTEPASLGQLGSLVKGYRALVGMKNGAKVRLIIPSHLGYGVNGSADIIPPNSILDFDVELTEVAN